jgi:hypothetical protein
VAEPIKPMTPEEARAELAPLFAALVGAHVARCSILRRASGKHPEPDMTFGPKLEEAQRAFARYLRYYELHFGPLCPYSEAHQKQMEEIGCCEFCGYYGF